MQSRLYIKSFNCQTSTGQNPQEFWEALAVGKTGIQKTDISSWPLHFKAYWKDQPYEPFSCKMNLSGDNYLEKISQGLAKIAAPLLTEPEAKMGIIFSSTKGAVEDYVWKEDFNPSEIDPLSKVLEETIKKLPPRKWVLTQVVSNSCASSHAAIALGSEWIKQGACDKVLVLAGDLIGPFIHTGFQSLKALSSTSAKPFQEERDGLMLGEALTAIVLSSEKSKFELVDVQIFNEAHTVTGPTPEARGMQRCLENLFTHNLSPDLAIAHGTATNLNDQSEDFVLSYAQEKFGKAFAIAGTKWSVGHTLGASGSIDVIAALLCLENQSVFSLPGEQPAVGFKAKNYQFGQFSGQKLEAALITSLGFGGTNGAILIRKVNL